MKKDLIKEFLDEKVEQYNHNAFIEDDPIQIVHQFSQKEDIEIIGLLISTIAWGNRKSIIKNGNRIVDLMQGKPYQFLMDNNDFSNLDFVHRTFNSIDLDFFFTAVRNIYLKMGGLEQVFEKDLDSKHSILAFREAMLLTPHENRSEKHLANPANGSSAKRINMFLRWMIRQDKKGVDFGIWKNHSPSKLFVPLDIHTGVSARKLGLITRKQNDWKALEELMIHLKSYCPEDPCKYDFALFGMSANNDLDF